MFIFLSKTMENLEKRIAVLSNKVKLGQKKLYDKMFYLSYTEDEKEKIYNSNYRIFFILNRDDIAEFLLKYDSGKDNKTYSNKIIELVNFCKSLVYISNKQ